MKQGEVVRIEGWQIEALARREAAEARNAKLVEDQRAGAALVAATAVAFAVALAIDFIKFGTVLF